MKKNFLFLLILSFTITLFKPTFAQVTDSVLLLHPEFTTSNYYAYNAPTKKLTQTPSGYKPFYISHYGRHGSRYHQPAAHYNYLYETLTKADSLNVLTEIGKSLLIKAKFLNEYAAIRAGDLTQIGIKQQQNIAKRMVKNFPEIFREKTINGKNNPVYINAYASTSVRCVLSMAAFLEELRALKPKLKIHQESSGYLMKFINPANFGKIIEDANTPEWKLINEKMYSTLNPNDMMNRIFNDTTYIKKNIDAGDLLSKIYEIENSLQSSDNTLFNFDKLWTIEERITRWKAQNAWWYSVLGYCNETGAKGPSTAKPVLQNILDMADSAIIADSLNSSNFVSATLRFGHDTAILPLAALMQLSIANARVSDLTKLHEHWNDFKIIPMSANLQIIFYKSTSKIKKPILVKVLYNEIEQTLPITCSKKEYCPKEPYYLWDDFYNFYIDILKK